MTKTDAKSDRRYLWNLCMFTVSFVISNLVSGIIYDVYVNYLQEVGREVAVSFWSYYGYSAFISAALLLLIPKIGYKALLLFCAATCTAAIGAILFFDNTYLYALTTLLALSGLQLHFAILSPYIAAYTKKDNKINWYSRVYYIGYSGYFLTTFLGGMVTVKFFSMRGHILYDEARKLTEYIEDMAPDIYNAYLQGNKDVLLLTGILSALAFIPVCLIKEQRSDYQMTAPKEKIALSQKISMYRRAIFNKYTMTYLIYWAMINFGMGLFTSYYTVFLNRNLHIDRATASFMVSFSYLALVLFMLFTPYIVKKIGQVNTLGGVSLLSIPFMLIIANGDKFGALMIPVVGFALFMRSGLVNLSYPVDSSLSMEIVDKQLRPIFATVINVVAGLASVVSGWVTGNILFVTQEGYRTAYYIAAVFYAVGCTLLLIGLRKFNWTLSEEKK